MRQEKLAETRIEGIAMHTVAGGVDEHCARTIDHISGSYLLRSWLQQIVRSTFCTFADLVMNRENRADGNVDVNIRGPIKRVEEYYIRPAWIFRRRHDRLSRFFRGHGTDVPACFQRLDECLMREDIEFRYLLALDVFVAREPENIHQSRFIHLAGDHLCGQGNLCE